MKKSNYILSRFENGNITSKGFSEYEEAQEVMRKEFSEYGVMDGEGALVYDDYCRIDKGDIKIMWQIDKVEHCAIAC